MKDKTMDENVIAFPKRAQPKSKEEHKAAQSNEQFKQSDASIRGFIEENFRKKPMVESKDDRIRLANNLWKILADVQPKASTKNILHAAGKGSDFDSTKRLSYYALNPDLSDAIKEKRALKLAKKVQHYTTIVSAAAKLSNTDESNLIKQLVNGTYYSQLPDSGHADIDVNAEGWHNVESAIKTAANKISTKYNLQHFFKSIRDLGIVDLTPIQLRRFSQRTGQPTRQWDLQEPPILVLTDELPPRPSVYLGEIRVCDDISCTIHLQPMLKNARNEEEEEEEQKERELLKRLTEAGFESTSVKGVATPVLLANLELLPLGRHHIVTPVLRLSPRTYIASAEELRELYRFPGSTGTEVWPIGTEVGELAGQIEQGRNYVNGHYYNLYYELDCEMVGESGTVVTLKIETDFGSALAEDSTVSIVHSASPSTSWILRFDTWARICLSNPVFTGDDNHYENNERSKIMNSEIKYADALTFFPGDTMAALLDRSLIYAPETASLTHLLDEDTSALTKELEIRIEEARARHRERLDELRRE